ncbi:MAG: helix-turn-helix transcriptional regulator [Clostridia bacterium]|nr:helix-turn-helix transcriptional regulator [Clostridia bacterium]
MTYHQRLRDLREDRDMTQREAAEKLFLHLTQYRRYETGERAIPLELACAVADLYGVSLDYLAGVTETDLRIEASSLSAEEKQLLTYYRRMNAENKTRLNERAQTLLSLQNK